MAWQFLGVSSVVEVTGTAHALVTTGISGLQAGDLLVACISSRIASTTSITLPTGGAWTLVSEQKANNVLTTTSAVASGMMAFAIRGASNPNLTFTHPTAPSVAIGRIVAYRGVAAVSSKDTQTSFTTAINTTAVSGTGLTTTQAGDLIVAMAAGGQEASWTAFDAVTDPTTASGATDTSTAPTAGTWIERVDSNTTTGADTSLAIFDAIRATAGATGNLTATASQGASHVVVAGAFRIAKSLSAEVGGYSFSGTAATLTRIRVTWNPSDKATEIVLSNSNLTASTVTADTAATVRVNRSHNTGKWYFEGVIDSRAGVDEISFGLLTSTAALDVFPGFEPGSIALYDTGTVFNDSVAQDTFKALDVGERVGIAVDFDAGKFWNRDSTGWYGDPAAGTGAATTFTPNTQLFAATQVFTVGDQATANFGNGAFTYTVPAGFLAWDEETIRAEAGSYSFSGTAATLTIAPFLVGYVFSGDDATLTHEAAELALSAESGSYSFAGQEVTGDRTYRLIVEAASYSFAGQEVTGDRTYRLIPEAGAFSFAGSDATLTYTPGELVLSAEAGSYAVSGTAASLERGYVLVAETFISAGGSPIGLLLTLTGGGGATYTFSGSPVDLTVAGDLVLAVEAGSYAVSGTAATLTYAPGLVGFVFTGSDAELTHEEVTEIILGAAAGSFAFSGSDASLEHGWRLVAEATSYSFSGVAASLEHGWEIAAEAGGFSFAGQQASLEHGWELVPDAGSYSFTGTDAALALAGEVILIADTGAYVFSGSDAALTYTPTEPVAPGYWQDPGGASDAEFWVRKWREQARALKPVPKPTAVYEPTVAMAEAAPAAVVRKTAAAPDPEVVELVDFVRLLEKL